MLFLPTSLTAQVYSQNIVGYYNLVLQPGGNLIANQLDNGNENTLDSLFGQSTPEGATFTEWDSSGLTYLPLSTYDTSSGWSINYTLGYGQGGLLTTPTAFTDTLVGSVWPGLNGVAPFVPPVVSGDGVFLLSCVVPIGNATFYDVTGLNPVNGDNVTLLNPATQQYTTTRFFNGVWNNGTPLLAVGESAFFGLGGGNDSEMVLAVPEPAAANCLAVGIATLISLARWRRQ